MKLKILYIFILSTLLSYESLAQILQNGTGTFDFNCKVQVGLSINQRTEQQLYSSKEGLAGTGFFVGSSFELESNSFDGGLNVNVLYSKYNAENKLLMSTLKFIRSEVGIYGFTRLSGNKVCLNGSVGKGWMLNNEKQNGIGGSIACYYEVAKRYSVLARWSYYDLNKYTIGLIEAGLQFWLF